MSIQYKTIHGAAGGIRFDVKTPPAEGDTLVLQGGQRVTYKCPGWAGMLLCADATGFEQMIFPQQVETVLPVSRTDSERGAT